MQAQKQQSSSYLEDKEFLSISYVSKEKFAKDYRKIYRGKPRAKKLFFVLVAELKKAILDGNVINFKHLNKLFEYINDTESPTLLKTVHNNFGNSTEAVNLVILACEHDRIEILDYIFGNCRIFKNVSIIAGRDIVPNIEDLTRHDAFYYAIRSGNVEILDLLVTKWPGNYFASRSLELDEILSRAYEQLKLQNVSLSNEMEIFVEKKLINLRFFSNSSGQFKSAKCSRTCISQRIDLVVKNITLLKSEYCNEVKVDAKFLFISRFIAQNIHILKRQLKLTYDRLPWEEIEFCLVAFLSSHLEQREINLFYRAVLDKSKILLYLENFAKTLARVKPLVKSLDTSTLAELPKLNRDRVIAKIIRYEPEFLQMYNDYRTIRDAHSLERVGDYLNLALATNPKEREGQILITRALLVIGEYFKNTLESPKLSSTTSELLLLSLPKNTRKIIVDLRNSLSHVYSLSKRTEIYENTDAEFFVGVQSDAKRIDNVIVDILYKNKMKIVETLMKKINSSESFDEIQTIAELLSSVKLEKAISQEFEMMELDKIENLIRELSNTITDQTNYEKELFDKINAIISSTKTKSSNIKADYTVALKLVKYTTTLLQYRNLDRNTLEEVKSCARKLLERFFPQIESHNLKEIVELSLMISDSAESRIRDDNLDTVNRLLYEICYIAQFDINDIRWVKNLRKKLHEKGSFLLASNSSNVARNATTKNMFDMQLTDKLSELKNILQSSGNLIDYKNNKTLLAVLEMLVLDIMSILGESGKYLENNSFFLDDSTPLLMGKSLRNHLAHGNSLLEVLLFDPSLAVVLNAEKLASENIVQNKKKVGKFVKDDPSKLNDKFDRDLVTITNQQNMFAGLAVGNIEKFKSCLDNGADIHGKEIDSSATTLHFAARGSDLELVKFIVDQNVSVDAKDRDGRTSLHVAAAHGGANIVEFFLARAPMLVDDRDTNNRTPLHFAAENGHLDIVEILLKSNADVDAKDITLFSPLHYAVRCNQLDVVEVLARKEVNVDIRQARGGLTSLHIAAEFGALQVANFLLQKGARVDAKTDEKETPLHMAAGFGHLEVARALILEGANVNAKAMHGSIPLLYAAESGYEKLVQILLEHESEVDNVTRIYNNTSLYYAAKYGHEQIVELLLDNGANTDIVTRAGFTPLHHACRYGRLKIVASLLEHGANIHLKDGVFGNTALHYAAQNGRKEIVRLLIRNGAEVDVKNFDDATPLHMAAFNEYEHIVAAQTGDHKADKGSTCPSGAAAPDDHRAVIEILLQNGARVDSRSDEGFTPLHVIALGGNYEATVLLVKRGADVNAESKCGSTPLHEAASKGHERIVAFLLKNGARADAECVGGTPLNVAAAAGHRKVVDTLVANGANVNLKSNDTLALISAVRNNNRELVEVLLAKGADVDADQGRALSLAAVSGYQDIVELLLKNHASVHFKGPGNESALHLAAARGHIEAVNALIAAGADLDAVTTASASPLCRAVEAGRCDVAEALLAHGARVDICTPLHLAAARGHDNIVEVLLRNGADIDAKDQEGRTALELAVSYGRLPIVEILVQHSRADLDSKGGRGLTLLHIAAQEKNLKLIKYLVDAGSNMAAEDGAGSKCIHISAREGFLDAVEFFLSKGMDVDEPSIISQTPLHYATLKNRTEVVKYLLVKGANVNAKDDFGYTPMHLAAAFGVEDVVQILLENGAFFNAADNSGKTPLELAAAGNPMLLDTYLLTFRALNNNKKGVVRLLSSAEKLYESAKSNSFADVRKLIAAGAFVDAKNSDTGATPLHNAARKGYEDILNILLRNKANPNSVCDKGFTALHYAVKFSHVKCAKMLLCRGAIYNGLSKSGETPVALSNDKCIADLFGIIDDSFKKIRNGNARVIENLSQISDGDLKAIVNARNAENQCLIAFASQINPQLGNKLKFLSQGDALVQLNRALAFLNQGEYQRGLRILERLVERRKQLLGPDNPATLEMQAYVAKGLSRRGDYQDALEMLEAVFVKQKEILGSDDQYTLDTRSAIALVMHNQGKDNEAYDIFREVYRKQKEILGPTNENTLGTRFHMALVLERLGKYDEALNINREILEINIKTLGTNHMNTISSRNNIAMILCSQGKYEEALKMYKEVLDRKKEIIGINHADTLRTMQSIAGVYGKQDKLRDSLNAYEEVLNIQKKSLQQNHPEILNTQHNIANVLYAQGKFVGAFKAFKEGYDQRKIIFGPNHPSVLGDYHKMELINKFMFKLEGLDMECILQHWQKEMNIAAGKGDIRTVEHQLQNGADVNAADTDGRTPLHFAVSKGHLSIVNVLLKNGADVTLVTNKGNTPLHTAASKDDEEIVQVLLQNVDRDKVRDFVNAKTTSGGTTSLHVAAKGGYLGVVKLLLKNGATYDVRNKEGKTPVDLATDQRIIELFELIEESFALVKEGSVEVVEKLKAVEPDEFAIVANARCAQGHGLLQVAIVNEHKNIVGALLTMLKRPN